MKQLTEVDQIESQCQHRRKYHQRKINRVDISHFLHHVQKRCMSNIDKSSEKPRTNQRSCGV